VAFLDESGFLLLPSVRRTWAPRGETPRLVHRYQRDKISAISAVTVSPTHRRLGFYCHLHLENITHVEVAVFLRLLLRHLRGPIMLLWDGGSIHGGADVQQVLARHPRLQVHRFPAYAPELNPDELAWEFLKDELANGCPLNVEALLDDLTHLTRRLRRSQRRLRGFVLGSDLPPFFSA
jgi:transposase